MADSESITITLLQSDQSVIDKIEVITYTSGQWIEIYPTQNQVAEYAGNLVVFRITVKNNGASPEVILCSLIDNDTYLGIDTRQTPNPVNPGDIFPLVTKDLVMPNKNWSITINVVAPY